MFRPALRRGLHPGFSRGPLVDCRLLVLFNSLVFPVFFAVVWASMRLLARRSRRWLLLLASYAFYGWWDWRFLSLILLSTAVDWGCALGIEARRSRAWVVLSVVTNLSILGIFKYLGFFTAELDRLLGALGLGAPLPVLHLVLPVGLSFYTFQSMAYTIDVWRGRTRACRDPVDFALFVAFFPQLVAGPIERSGRLLPQLRELAPPSARQLAEGGGLLLWGYFKKLVVADNLAVLVDRVFDGAGPVSAPLAWAAAYAFTWQIYCDFSGYTDIARGLGKCLGVELSVNFRLPFFASGPRDLWRRWHISLSEWLRDYLYIPLGGGRGGRLRTARNLLLTMLLGGLWHGANWTFLAWGAWHGLALVLQRAVRWPFRGVAGRVLAVLLTFHLTAFGFVVFRARDLAQAGLLLARLAGSPVPAPGDSAAWVLLVLLVGPVLLVELVQHLRGDDLEWPSRLHPAVQVAAAAAITVAITVFGATFGQRFIYFQF